MLTVDDFAPAGPPHDVQRLHQKADRIIRAQGNNSGRQRMRADGTLRPVKPPRGLVLSTGEDVPRGQSLRSRMQVIEIGPGDIDPAKLTRCQEAARAGDYAKAMAEHVRWLAGRMDKLQPRLRGQIVDHRAEAAGSSMHRRTPDVMANLGVGLRQFLRFARAVGAINRGEAEDIWARGWAALGRVAAKQGTHQAAAEPARRFLELVASAIASGNAHLAAENGRAPIKPEAWGWRHKKFGAGDFRRDEWQPQGDRIGWVGRDGIYIDPDASFKAAQQMAGGGEGLAIGVQALGKRLDEKRLLIREDGRDELKVRKTLEGRATRVLHLRPGALTCGEPAEPSKPAKVDPKLRRTKLK